MHVLHTTPAFVLTSYPHGESNRVYKMFTREFGLLYVHGQGVRMLKSRNRYALVTHGFATVTLVRGRGGVWRLTGAQGLTRPGSSAWRRALNLSGKLLAEEDPAPGVFEELCYAHELSETLPRHMHATFEALTLLRTLHALGYVASPPSSLVSQVLALEHIAAGVPSMCMREEELVQTVNSVIAELPIR